MKELISAEKNSYKANLHMHTNISDGRITPEETKAVFKSMGYSVVAFTDHEVMVPHPELTDSEFIALTGTELCVGGRLINSIPVCYHMNFISKDPDKCDFSAMADYTVFTGEHTHRYSTQRMMKNEYRREYTRECINDMIRRGNEEGFLVTLNHICWSTQNHNDYTGLKGLWGVECYNNVCAMAGFEETMQPIDDLLHEDEQVFPLATDDAHTAAACGGGATVIQADRLEYGCIMDALERGDFYSTTGPEIYSLSFDNGRIKVSCSPVAKILVNTDCRAAYRRNATADAPLTECEIDVSSWFNLTRKEENYVCKPYLRVTLVDERGNRAWTRAYTLDELL